jgi:hypothetical protein
MRVKTLSCIKKGIFFFLILFITKASYAQFYHGFEFGANYNNADFIIGESVEPSGAVGILFGYLAERDLSDNLFFRIGINYNKRQFEAINRRGINTTDEKWTVDVIEIPVNLGYYLNRNQRNFQFFVDAGVNLGYNNRVAVKNDIETIRLDIGSDADIKQIAIGANISTGLLIKKRVKIRLNYYHGLSNIVNIDNDSWKNKTFSLSLNYFLKEREIVY